MAMDQLILREERTFVEVKLQSRNVWYSGKVIRRKERDRE